MDGEHFLHLKFEYNEALESKRDILYSEKTLISMGRKIKGYGMLRSEELKLKAKLQKKIMEAVNVMKKIHKIMPKVKIPEMLREGENRAFSKPVVKRKTDDVDSDIEFQLQEIQRKLNALNR